MKSILNTNPKNTLALIARVALGLVVFPHGAQKLLGWFGGGGFDGTMGYFTEGLHLPYFIGLLVIFIEFFCALMLIAGWFTRVAAIAIIGQFIGIIFISGAYSRFFMNWASEAARGEGLEYFIMLFALGLIALIAGGGKASIDAQLIRNK